MRSTSVLAATALAAFVLASAPTGATADAIGPPPASCPEGADPLTCHGPATCAADSCSTDGDCDAGEICQSRSYCVREHCCRGGWVGCTEPSHYVIHVEGPCSSSGTCSAFDTACRGIMVCVPGVRDGGAASEDAGTDAGALDAGGEPEPDAGSEDVDGGDGDPDAGGTASDAGGGAMDGGGTDSDSGAAAMDGGGDRVDAGSGGPTEGGCCSVTGPRESLAGELFALALGLALLRRVRRRRAASR